MTDKEKVYDEIIAPMLLEVAKKCEELEMPLVAYVEWEPGEGGSTVIGNRKNSIVQYMTFLATRCKGNIDKLCMELIKEYDVQESIFLHKYDASCNKSPCPTPSNTHSG